MHFLFEKASGLTETIIAGSIEVHRDKGAGLMERAFLLGPSQAVVGKWLESFKEFPVRQKPASFNLDDVMRKLSEKQGAND